MMKREPPRWPHQDPVARECDVTPVAFGVPIPPNTWCHYCGFLANTRDHIVPDSVGGAKAWWNLVPACIDCNNGKAERQACACLFCLRAIALWHLGFRRTGASHRDKKNRNKRNRAARSAA